MIHVLIGTRAQLIKMAPIMHEMNRMGIDYNFIFMAQHRETIDEILLDFELRAPDHVLCDIGKDIVRTPQMLWWSIKVLFHGVRHRKNLFHADKGGLVLLHGDAPPVLLGALIARSQGLKIGVVEAGLRSHNLLKPFPEELTRVLIGKLGLADVFYCQDEQSLANVKKFKGRGILTHGNTIIDAIQLALAKHDRATTPPSNENGEPYAVVSLHRFETITNADRLAIVIGLLQSISGRIRLKFILHPPTRKALQKNHFFQSLQANENIDLLPRMIFTAFNRLLVNSEFVITDGGSNQEESAFLGVPCLLFRTETERLDGLEENVVLSKLDPAVIDRFVQNYSRYRRPTLSLSRSPSSIIIEDLRSFA